MQEEIVATPEQKDPDNAVWAMMDIFHDEIHINHLAVACRDRVEILIGAMCLPVCVRGSLSIRVTGEEGSVTRHEIRFGEAGQAHAWVQDRSLWPKSWLGPERAA